MLYIVERVDGKRIYREFKPDHHFYVNDPRGTTKSIYGDPVKKISPRTYNEKQKLLKTLGHNTKTWETDYDPVFRCLEQNYQNADIPRLNVAFFDIETSFDKNSGWSEATDANNFITSISIHLQWLDETICLSIPPPTLTWEEANVIAEEVGNVVLFNDETDMLLAFVDIIQDADIISGWNSEVYDIVYTINRIKKIIGKEVLPKLSLWDQLPKVREFDRNGKTQYTYDLIGRVHLDYLQLYKKYNYEERYSYSLDAISEIELGERKVQYDGTLDELYHDDYKMFLQYNIQDTKLLDKLDKKLQFIDLANSIAHANCVLIQTTMGAVAVTDQAVTIEAHNRKMVCPDKKSTSEDNDENKAAGGWVAMPKKGLHKWIASTDMKSLYPSTIRALNMSPETIIGQIRLDRTNSELESWIAKGGKHTFAGWWNDRFNVLEMEEFYSKDNGTKLILDLESGGNFEITGQELNDIIFESGQPWCISANGTIFRTDKEGVIPGLLTKWYGERKTLQAKADFINNICAGFQLPPELIDVLKTNNLNFSVDKNDLEQNKPKQFTKDILSKILESEDANFIEKSFKEYGLCIKNDKLVPMDEYKKIWEDSYKFWDKQQLVKKISLNSAYGALLNPYSRFFDQRLGQSTTLTGRTITRHMAAKTNEVITGKYDQGGEAIIYGDTDSCFFTTYPTLKNEIERGEIPWTKENIIDLYNKIAKDVSSTFPSFLKSKLNVPESRSTGVIASSRETVSESGLWIVKKRYACLMFDKDNIRLDVGGKPGKIKAMGLDLKRSDTPKFVQNFLSEILLDTLCGKGEEVVVAKIREFKEKFENLKPWQQGTPRAVNKLTYYRDQEELYIQKKMRGELVNTLTIPGHVRASLSWNRLREIHRDQNSMRIIDGQKIVVCKLRETTDNKLTSIAYPVDEPHLPDWFTSLPFDSDDMMAGIVDKKIQNLLGVLKWDFRKAEKEKSMFSEFFG